MFKKLNKNQEQASTDFGNIIPFKCSHCKESSLHLFESSHIPMPGLFSLFSNINKERAPLWFVKCKSCGLESEAQEEDTPFLLSIIEEAERLKAGEIKPEEYYTLFWETESKFIKELYLRTLAWSCSECDNDDIPMTFETCWNCGAECPEPEKILNIDGNISFDESPVFGPIFGLSYSSTEHKEDDNKDDY